MELACSKYGLFWNYLEPQIRRWRDQIGRYLRDFVDTLIPLVALVLLGISQHAAHSHLASIRRILKRA